MRQNLLFGNSLLCAAALAGALMFSVTPRLRADDDACQRQVANADHHLHEAIEHHGYESKEADHSHHELNEARESCWNSNHKWWDEDAHRWHSDRDWNDHGHDRDADHDRKHDHDHAPTEST